MLFGSAGTSATAVAYVALAVVALAVVALTAGEVAGGAATRAVALGDVPDEAEGRHQSVFSMASSAARIVGPAVALPLVVALPGVGWLALAVAMAAACVGIARLATAPPPTRSAPDPGRPRRVTCRPPWTLDARHAGG